MIITVILSYCNLFLFSKKYLGRQDKAASFVDAVILWSTWIFAATELLSIFHMLHVVSVFVIWGIADVVLFVWLFWQCRSNNQTVLQGIKVCLSAKITWDWKTVVIILTAGCVLILAIWTVPYNWDSMTYHLPRICAWTQNRSVAHYATSDIRQIGSPVLAEFINLHVYLLTGQRDILFHLLQCFSYLASAVLVYRIAQKLNCSSFFCFLSSLLYLSMPIAMSEALTTQVDNFAALWLLFFVYLLIDFTNPQEAILWNKQTIWKVIALGFCVAYGYLAKPSVCIAMVLYVLWLLLICIIRKDKITVLLKLIVCVIPSIILPLLPEMIRNIRTFQAFLPPAAGERQLVGTLNPFYLIINFLKNYVQNLPNVYLYDSGNLLTKMVQKAAQFLQVPLNAPEISEDGRTFYLWTPPNYGHDTAINPLLVLLITFCVIWGILKWREIDFRHLYCNFSFVTTFNFFFFCMILRWEPFVTRYMSAYLALLCPVIALQIQKRTSGPGKERLRQAITCIICFLCLTELLNMGIYHRNMCTQYQAGERPEGYFANRQGEREPYQAICQNILDCGYQTVGLKLAADSYEYPFWAMLNNRVQQMGHVLVDNESQIYAEHSFLPECIIWVGALPQETIEWQGIIYGNRVDLGEGYSVFSR